MDTNVILVHDPYDVFLAVGFGFCYGSALLPAVRTLDKYKTWTKESQALDLSERIFRAVGDWRTWLVRGMVLLRGILTIVGLACLYGWYSFYLKRFYPNELPVYRVYLDWISLGLFAIGANCWDNEDHYETLYGLIQGLATVTFGFTCYAALPKEPAITAVPLLKAIYWCVIVVNAYVFDLVLTFFVGRIFKDNKITRGGVFCLGIAFTITILASAGLDWAIFSAAKIADVVHSLLGIGVYAMSGFIFVVILILSILVGTKAVRARFRSLLLTFVPMSILIWVTFRNYRILFPHG